jgi:hypothetical protein
MIQQILRQTDISITRQQWKVISNHDFWRPVSFLREEFIEDHVSKFSCRLANTDDPHQPQVAGRFGAVSARGGLHPRRLAGDLGIGGKGFLRPTSDTRETNMAAITQYRRL